MKSITKNIAAPVFVGFLLGLWIMYLYSNQKIASNLELTKKIVEHNVQSLAAANVLVDSCNTAYVAFGECILGQSACDLEKTKAILRESEKQKLYAQELLRNASLDSQELAKEVLSK